jgi:hypothetical protein
MWFAKPSGTQVCHYLVMDARMVVNYIALEDGFVL